jgi:hypothetical protein
MKSELSIDFNITKPKENCFVFPLGRRCFLLRETRNYPKNLATFKEVFDLYKIKIAQNNLTVKRHFDIQDGSRLSTEENAPLFRHRMTDSTFVSTIRIKPQTAFLSIEMLPEIIFWHVGHNL